MQIHSDLHIFEGLNWYLFAESPEGRDEMIINTPDREEHLRSSRVCLSLKAHGNDKFDSKALKTLALIYA